MRRMKVLIITHCQRRRHRLRRLTPAALNLDQVMLLPKPEQSFHNVNHGALCVSAGKIQG